MSGVYIFHYALPSERRGGQKYKLSMGLGKKNEEKRKGKGKGGREKEKGVRKG